MLPKRRFFSWVFFVVFLITSCDNVGQNIKKNLASLPAKKTIVKQQPKDQFAWKPIKYDTSKRYIYLTFDDGPQNGTTACLELVKKLNVKATFFMVGSHANSENLAALVRTVKYNYPQVLLANHSTSHANNKYKFFYHHSQIAAADFYLAQKTLHVPYKIIRLPGNSAWVVDSVIKASGLVKPVCHLLDSSGYSVIGWDVEWNFNHKTAYPMQRPYKIAEQVDTALARNHVHTKNHVVILTHDRMFRKENFTDSLAKFINILKKDPRNVFETIDHYPRLKF